MLLLMAVSLCLVHATCAILAFMGLNIFLIFIDGDFIEMTVNLTLFFKEQLGANDP